MYRIQGRLLVLGITITVLAILGCTTNRTGMIKPYSFQAASLDKEVFGAHFDYPLQFDAVTKGPKPIPGRLLVRVRAKDIKQLFKYSTPGDKNIRQVFSYLHRLPANLRLRDAEEIEHLKDGRMLLRLHLEKPSSPKDIQQLLRKTPFKLSKRTEFLRENQQLLDAILVEIQLGQLPFAERRLGFRSFPQLIRKSDLHKAFHDIGVRSVHRVFKMVEVPTANGAYQVVPMKSLMEQAKSRFPLRASRGHDHVKLPENMENWFLLQLDRKANLNRVAKVLKDLPEIETVEFDYPVQFHQSPQQEPEYGTQWALKSGAQWGIDVEPIWPYTAANTAVTIAVIGSGIKEDLDEFEGRIWQNPDPLEIPGDGIDNDGNGYADDITGITVGYPMPSSASPIIVDKHETMVAGIIAAAVNENQITGVVGNADVRLMNISLGRIPSCSGLAEAIQYATLEGADVINMSLGVPPHGLVAEAIQNALSKDGGIIMVASAGNDKVRVSQDYNLIGAHYPAWYDGVIAVGGTDINGHLWSEPFSNVGSNFGVGLDLVAPALDVQTITYTSTGQTAAELGSMTGTSASAALVSGVAALLIGKYPDLTAAEVRSQLRATSMDIIDPLGNGSNLVKDDIYTGSGLVNASHAVPTTQPNPVVVDLHVERISISSQMNGGIRNAVPDKPDLGITVQGDMATSWQLHYVEGDWPIEGVPESDQWVQINTPSEWADAIEIPRIDACYSFYPLCDNYLYTNVEDTYKGINTNILNTEGLTNRQIYTMRLTATDASGHTYTAYDWFMPVRAMLIFPPKNTPIPTRWGWPEIDGIVDTRPGATYNLSILPMTGPPNPDWQLSGLIPLMWPEYEINRGANFVRLSVGPRTYADNYPTFAAPPSGEGWHEIRLEVLSPSGSTEVDTQEIYIDNSGFTMRPGWPKNTSPDVTQMGAGIDSPKGIVVADMNGNEDYRIFVLYSRAFLCLKPGGEVQKLPLYAPSQRRAKHYPPAFLVEDLDGDGVKEIVVLGRNLGKPLPLPNYPDQSPPIYGDYDEYFFLLLRSDCTVNWHVSYPNANYHLLAPAKVTAGDIDGDNIKEIIAVQNVTNEEIGYLHVLDFNGQELPGWQVEIGPGPINDVAVVADIDNDGKDEIMLDHLRYVYEDTGMRKQGWPPADLAVNIWLYGGIQVRELDGNPDLEVIEYGTAYSGSEKRYAIDVRKHNGTRLPGNWPVYLDAPVVSKDLVGWGDGYFKSQTHIYVDTAQLVPGGNMEIAVAYDKIQVMDSNGSLGIFPEIVLDGEARGLKIMDVDSDGELEFVVMVLKLEDDDGYKMKAYGNLEAYKLNGTPLSNGKWPIRIAFDPWMALGNSVAIEDIDGDGQLEVINFLGHHPHQFKPVIDFSNLTGQDYQKLYQSVIEVLDIR